MTELTQSVRLETVQSDGVDVALVIVNNPPVNVLSWHVRQGLFDGVTQAIDGGAGAVVIICDGRTFIAGADVTEFGGSTPDAAGLPDVQAAMENAPIPVVAAIHGTALGGGLEVALCAHYRVAVESAKCGLPEVNLGLLPGAGGTQRLPRLVGVPKALEAMTSGRHMAAAEAHEAGLVDEVVDGGVGATALAGTGDPAAALQTLVPETALGSGTVAMDARTKAKMQGYEGDPCGDCGNYTLVRNGTCMKCNTCGGTSGCS